MTQETTTVTEAIETPAFTVADLATTKLIIEVASGRGAFKADELATVGQIYNKLQTFLAAVLPPAAPEAEPEGEAEPEASAATTGDE